jgi:hypothetical protein
MFLYFLEWWASFNTHIKSFHDIDWALSRMFGTFIYGSWVQADNFFTKWFETSRYKFEMLSACHGFQWQSKYFSLLFVSSKDEVSAALLVRCAG